MQSQLEDRIMKNLEPAAPFNVPVKDNCSILPVRVFLIIMIITLLSLVSDSCFASDSCVTADCHADMGKAKFVHEPVANSECDACHAETGKTHPGDKGAFELTEQGPALCLQCHDNPGEGKKHIHPPILEDCTNCHNPHQGSRQKFLHEPLGDLCLMCHDQIEQIINDSNYKHEPVAKGECLNCHVPHASNFSPMLRIFYPRNVYTKFTSKKFALCFKCHESDAFTNRLTTDATNFRNGDRSLHYVHVNRPKGRVCNNCHGVHGAEQPKIIHSESPAFGAWNIPIDVKMTKTGATCFVGCHKERSYDRIKKVVNN